MFLKTHCQPTTKPGSSLIYQPEIGSLLNLMISVSENKAGAQQSTTRSTSSLNAILSCNLFLHCKRESTLTELIPQHTADFDM